MTAPDSEFAGSIPNLYDRYLGPLLFEPYAIETARRARTFAPSDILETAAGTGIVTNALVRELPDARIVATDLNSSMLEIAADHIRSDHVQFHVVDAQDLPFASESFDLVVCQFGIMFYPDKVKANAEVHRVLRTGGHYIALIWDAIENNPASKIAMDALACLFRENPPTFLSRTPHGYSDAALIEHEMLAGGFRTLEIETVKARSLAVSAREAAIGLCEGTPLRNELELRKEYGLEASAEAVRDALARIEENGTLDSWLSALVITATK
jgi:ubiquinone/menaquinone biosynthesis C-methylase UbiE